jgi:MoxR-like ATPase
MSILDFTNEEKSRIQRLPAEIIYREELEKLGQQDKSIRPDGWQLSPHAVEKFILGDDALGISRKFVGSREMIVRLIVGLATNRGAMLIGEPGTAKSWLSELICAAISHSSTLTIQGGAITHSNQLLYTWNEKILNTKGPCMEALVPGPIFIGMEKGTLVRFEELARCAGHIQDAVLSIISERQILIPELSGQNGILYARNGFNLIATSNSLDKGVHDMSAALKRRLNFETINPIAHVEDEMDVVIREATKLMHASGIEMTMDTEIIQCLVIIFHELRRGETLDGRSTHRLASAILSTAEAVSVVHSMGVYAHYYSNDKLEAEDLVSFIIGTVLKDNREDIRRLGHYFETEVSTKEGQYWQGIYNSFRHLVRLL